MTKLNFKPALDLAEITAESREHIAKKLFDFERIRNQITEYAAKGKGRLRISQSEALNLSETKAAKGLCAKLKKRGYGVSWVSTAIKTTYSNGTIEMVGYEELAIAWGSQGKEEYKDSTEGLK